MENIISVLIKLDFTLYLTETGYYLLTSLRNSSKTNYFADIISPPMVLPMRLRRVTVSIINDVERYSQHFIYKLIKIAIIFYTIFCFGSKRLSQS